MNDMNCSEKKSKKENVFIFDHTFTAPSTCYKPKPKKECSSVILSRDHVIVPDLKDQCTAKDIDDDDCVSLTSQTSYESFNSWVEDDILNKERERAKIEFSKKYNDLAKECT